MERLNKFKENTKAITLIALVVTITQRYDKYKKTFI